MKFEFQLFKRTFKMYFYTHKELNKYVAGITNKCVDGKYVIFLDYDDIPLKWVMEEIHFLLQEHDLGVFHLFRTNNGFHAICTEKVTLRKLIAIMRDSSTDAAYLSVPLRRAKKLWTLRVTKKGRLIKYVNSSYGKRSWRQISRPHAVLLNKLYNVPLPPPAKMDKEKEFTTGHYYIEG